MLGFVVVVICLFVYFSDRSQYIALAGLEVGRAGLELAALLALSSQSLCLPRVGIRGVGQVFKIP